VVAERLVKADPALEVEPKLDWRSILPNPRLAIGTCCCSHPARLAQLASQVAKTASKMYVRNYCCVTDGRQAIGKRVFHCWQHCAWPMCATLVCAAEKFERCKNLHYALNHSA
jgi:hypothetical protein